MIPISTKERPREEREQKKPVKDEPKEDNWLDSYPLEKTPKSKEVLEPSTPEVVELSISTGKKPVIIKPFESTDNFDVLMLLMPASVDNS